MNRTQLVRAVAGRSRLSAEDVDVVLRTLADVVGESLAQHDKVVLTGFVTFGVRHRPARSGRNPSTGQPMEIVESWVPKIMPGSGLRTAVRGSKAVTQG